MTQITIPLDDESTARLRELAQQRGESVEQTAQALLLSTLPQGNTGLAPDDPDGSRLILSMLGSIPAWPGIEGPVNTPNEEIDRILVNEAMNPHDERASRSQPMRDSGQ